MLNGVPFSKNKLVQDRYKNGFSTKNSAESTKTLKESKVIPQKRKLHFWIYQLVKRVKNGESRATEHEDKFVNNAKSKIRVQLSSKSAKTLDSLNVAGFENHDVAGKDSIIQQIDIRKIADLIEIEQIKYIFPSLK